MEVYKLNIDSSQVRGAITILTQLLDNLEDTQEQTKGISDEFRNLGGQATSVFTSLKNTSEKIGKSFENIKGSITQVVGKAKTLALTLLGVASSAFFAASGTNRELTQGNVAKIGWAGQRAYESASDLTGFNADFMATQRAINEGYLEGDFAPLQMGAEDVSRLQKMSGDKAYFEMVDRFASKLEDLINKQGEFEGKIAFGSIFGESLQSILGMGVTDFINNLQSGNIERFKGSYYNNLSTYKGTDTKSLAEGEKALNEFMNTFKNTALSLSSQILPGLTKGMKALTGVFTDFTNWLNTSETVGKLKDLFGEITGLLTDVFGKFTDIVSIFSSDNANFAKGSLNDAVESVKNLREGNYSGAFQKGSQAAFKTLANIGVATVNVMDKAIDAVDPKTPEEKMKIRKENSDMWKYVGQSISDKLESWFGGGDKEPTIKAKVDNKLTIDIKVNGKSNQVVSLVGDAGKSVNIGVGDR